MAKKEKLNFRDTLEIRSVFESGLHQGLFDSHPDKLSGRVDIPHFLFFSHTMEV